MDKKDAGPENVPPEKKEKKKLNYFEGLMNFLKCLLGAGILGGPYGYSQLGWVSGLIVGTIVIFILTYATRILILSMREICRLRELEEISYPDAARECFKEGPKFFQKANFAAEIIVKVFLVLYHFNICPVYVVIIAESVRDVVSQYFVDGDFDVRLYMLCAMPLLILIMLINNIKALTPFSVMATVFIAVGLTMIVYYMVATKLPPISSIKPFNCVLCIPTYVGLILLACTSTGVLIAIDRVMKVPRHFTAPFGVINVGSFINYLMVMGFAFMGYWRYGEFTKDNILLNIPQQEKLSQATKILYAIALYFSYPLQSFPVVQIVWTEGFSVKCRPERRLLFEMLIRMGIVLASIVVAVSIPFFGIIASLNGSIAVTTLGIAIPSIMDISLRYPDKYGPGRLALVRDIFFIIFAVIFLISGVTLSFIQLYHELSGRD